MRLCDIDHYIRHAFQARTNSEVRRTSALVGPPHGARTGICGVAGVVTAAASASSRQLEITRSPSGSGSVCPRPFVLSFPAGSFLMLFAPVNSSGVPSATSQSSRSPVGFDAVAKQYCADFETCRKALLSSVCCLELEEI